MARLRSDSRSNNRQGMECCSRWFLQGSTCQGLSMARSCPETRSRIQQGKYSRCKHRRRQLQCHLYNSTPVQQQISAPSTSASSPQQLAPRRSPLAPSASRVAPTPCHLQSPPTSSYQSTTRTCGTKTRRLQCWSIRWWGSEASLDPLLKHWLSPSTCSSLHLRVRWLGPCYYFW